MEREEIEKKDVVPDWIVISTLILTLIFVSVGLYNIGYGDGIQHQIMRELYVDGCKLSGVPIEICKDIYK